MDEYEYEPSRLPTVLFWLLPIPGAAIGGVVGWWLHGQLAEPVKVTITEPKVIRQELTPEEVKELCGDSESTRNELESAQAKVVSLQSQLAAKEAEIQRYVKDEQEDAANARVAAARRKELEAEVASLRAQLAQAVAERDQLMVELKQTVRKLEEQIQETEKQKQRAEQFKAESHENAWTAFVANAKVEICDRGSRRRHEKCHEAVAAMVEPHHDRYIECVGTFQSTPLLVRQEDKKAPLPRHAVWLGEDDRFTRNGWYIQFCDPTLPEAGEPSNP